ncbi:unnamed protein product, partial [Prorocentrum cordatum]
AQAALPPLRQRPPLMRRLPRRLPRRLLRRLPRPRSPTSSRSTTLACEEPPGRTASSPLRPLLLPSFPQTSFWNPLLVELLRIQSVPFFLHDEVAFAV